MERKTAQSELSTFGITLMKRMQKGTMCGLIVQKLAK